MTCQSLLTVRKRFAKLTGRGLPKLAAIVMLTSGLILAELIAIEDRPAYGCSCAPPESVLVERDRATAVFTGTVRQMTPIYGGYEVEFSVFDQWKGDVTNTIRIKTTGQGASCGYAFQAGETYLVYAANNFYPIWDDNDLIANICGRTTLLSNADADIAELNSQFPSVPTEGTEGAGTGCGY